MYRGGDGAKILSPIERGSSGSSTQRWIWVVVFDFQQRDVKLCKPLRKRVWAPNESRRDASSGRIFAPLGKPDGKRDDLFAPAWTDGPASDQKRQRLPRIRSLKQFNSGTFWNFSP